MSTKQHTQVLDSMLQGVRQATEANLRLQQDWLRNWTRYWPGFTNRPVSTSSATPGESWADNPWAVGLMRTAEAQRKFATQQYDAALEVLDVLSGLAPVDLRPLTVSANATLTPTASASVSAEATVPAAPEVAVKAEFAFQAGVPALQVVAPESQVSQSVAAAAPATATSGTSQHVAPKAEATGDGLDASVIAAPQPAAPKPAVAKSVVSAAKAVTENATAKVEQPALTLGAYPNIREKVAVVTGAGSGIGEAVARELALRGAKAVLLVDRSEAVQDLAKSINTAMGRNVAEAKIGDTTDEAFRKRVFNDAAEKYGLISICVPAAGITRDALAVVMNKETGKAEIYPTETFRQVTEVNLIAPIYWGIEMVARIAEDRRQRGLKRWEPEENIQGVVVFLGSVSSQGNKGQISYAVAKAGLEGAAATLTKEAIFHGVRCGIIHPGFTDTPMARALGQEFLDKNVLPYTQLRRLIRPEEIADAICFMISNSAVSGELWADAGWHGPA
jgi:NAD(P)-dependent dehydrogenase (short-subunit alcohol dehydrogenase family)